MKTVEIRIQDVVLTAKENLVIPRLELAMRSANAFSGRSLDGNVFESDQKDYLGNVKELQMTASGGISSHTPLRKSDEIRDNTTVEGDDLAVNEKHFDQQTHIHHIFFLITATSQRL